MADLFNLLLCPGCRERDAAILALEARVAEASAWISSSSPLAACGAKGARGRQPHELLQ
jgi:hypothetical protein